MADAKGKEKVVGIKLDTTKFLQGLKEVSGGLEDLRKRLGQALKVKIDTQQFLELLYTLQQGFKGLGAALSESVKKGAADATATVQKTAQQIDAAFDAAGKQVQQSLATSIAAGAATGVGEAEKSLNQFESAVTGKFKAFQREYASLTAQQKAMFDSLASRRGAVGLNDREGFRNFAVEVNTKDTEKGPVSKEYLSPSRDQDIKNFFAEVRKDAEATTAAIEKSHAAANKLVEGELIAKEKAQAAANRLVESETIAKEKAHAQANKMVEGEIVAKEKAHARANKLVESEQIAVEKKHAQANKLIEGEQIAVEKKHAQANKFIENERIAVEKKQNEANQLIGRELGQRERAHGRALQMIEDERQAFMKGFANAQRNAARNGIREFNWDLRRIDDATPVMPTGRSSASVVTAQREVNSAYKEADNLLSRQLATHDSIGKSVANTAFNFAKWLVFFRIIHDVTRGIENAISGFIQNGIQYAKAMETQQLGLRGILAENFTLTDQHGKQITGMAALVRLQTEAERQWRQIQASSLAVVGTTEDLMGLYEGILPFAARLGKGLDDVQNMTKSAAVAASLLNVSFQDARSALIAMLQGRALTRNRLVGMLGFTREDLEGLKGTPELFDKIQGKLDEFLALAPEAQKTIAATAESLKDMMGMVGKAFVDPVTQSFARFVTFLTNALFIIQKGGLVPNEQFRAFLNFVTDATARAIAPLKEFGKALKESTGGDMQLLVKGALDIIAPFVQLAVVLAKAAIELSKFIALNTDFVKALAWIGVVWGGVTGLAQLAGWLNTVSKGTGLFALALRTLVPPLQATSAAATATTSSSTAMAAAMGNTALVAKEASAGMAAFAQGLKLLAGAGIIAVVTIAIGEMLQKLMRWNSEAKAAGAIAASLQARDARGALQNVNQLLASDDPGRRIQGARAVVEAGNKALSVLHDNQWDSVEGIRKSGEAWATQLEKIDQEYQKIADKGKNITQADKDRLAELMRQRGIISTQKDDLNTQLEIVADVVARQQQLKSVSQDSKNESRDPDLMSLETFMVSAKSIFDPTARMKGSARRTAMGIAADEINKSVDALKSLRVELAALKEQRDKNDDIKVTPKKVDDNDPARPKFRDQYNEHVAIKKAELDIEAELDKLAVAKKEMTDEEANRRAESREQEMTAFINAELAIRLEKFKKYKADVAAYNATVDKDKRISADQYADIEAGIQRDFAENVRTARLAAIKSDISLETRKAAFAKSLEEYRLQLEATESNVSGRIADKAVAEYEQFIRRVKDLRPATAEQLFAKDQLLRQMEAMLPKVAGHAQNEADLKNSETTLRMLQRQEALLNQQFKVNAISASEYVSQLNRLRAAQQATLGQKYQELLYKRSELLGAGPDADAASLENVNQQLADVAAQMREIGNISEKIRVAFASWADLSGDIASFMSGVAGASSAIADVTQVIERASKFPQIIDKFNGLRARVLDILSPGLGVQAFQGIGGLQYQGGANSYMTSYGLGETGLVGTQTTGFQGLMSGLTGSTGALKEFGKATNDGAGGIGKFLGALGGAESGKAATTLQKTMGALSIAGMGAGIAIGIATALFQRAVQKNKDAIEKGIKSITDAVSNGSEGIGDAYAQLQRQREQDVQKYSQTKAGRKALEDELPKIDQQLQDWANKIQQAKTDFKAKLEAARLGSGPFGDFAKMLLDLQQTSADYLKNFETESAAWVEAKKQIDELYQLTLKNYKQNLEDQSLGFETEALSSAQKVIDLLDQHSDLMDQLVDLGQQRQDLADQQAQLAADSAKQARDLEKERQDRAQKILDLETEIGDAIRKAADDEASIRQKGVLEGSETIAQQKARDISNVRYDAAKQLEKLRKDLAEAKDWTDFNDKVADGNKQLQKRSDELAKQAANLDKQNAKLFDQLRLNEIDIETAQRIAGLEGSIYDISGDRFALEARRGQIEIEQARIKVRQWSEVQQLIDRIVSSGEGIIFNPPPGFPQIHVNIGDIVIDNSDNSVNGGGSGGPGGPGPGGPGGGPPGRGPFDRSPEDRLTRQGLYDRY